MPQWEKQPWVNAAKGRKVPQYWALARQDEGRLALILLPEPDSLQWTSSPLAQLLFRKGYHQLIIGKPGEDVLQRRSLDSRPQRLNDISEILRSNDSVYRKQLLIIGIEEGGYLVPELARVFNAKRSIIINAGVMSPLFELEQLSLGDTLTQGQENWLHRQGFTPKDLQFRIGQIKNKTQGQDMMTPYRNSAWMSYYRAPGMEDFARLPGRVLWINFAQHPWLSPQGMQLWEMLALSHKRIRAIKMEGLQAFPGQGENYTLLKEEINAFLSED